jgi:pentafunctional AROM polypeptide
MIPLLDELTEHARALGTVNTIIPVTKTLADGTTHTKLVGDNTDWKVIVRCIREVRTSQRPRNTTESALVLGAGDAARAALYALRHLDVPKIYLVNHTAAVRAHDLAQSLQMSDRVQVLTTLTDPKTNQVLKMPTIIISTVPSHALTITSSRKSSSSTSSSATLSPVHQQRMDTLHMPEEILSWRGHHSSGTMVVVDLAYVSHRTSLIRKAKAHGWSTVDGMSLLLTQGFEQFQMWTGRRAPAVAITEAVLASERPPSSV